MQPPNITPGQLEVLAALRAGGLLNSDLAQSLRKTVAQTRRITKQMVGQRLIIWGDKGWERAEQNGSVEQPEPPVVMAERAVKAMDAAAYYGLTGDFVNLVSPESETDPHALLLCFLVGCGAIVGRRAHFLTEATRQCVNEFTVVVGDTAKARKGTATDRVLDILRRVDEDFMESQLCRGMATGEGLIYRIRDGRGDDPGVDDKRLLCVETEFSSVLRSIRMNKLSEDLRNAFDGNPIERVLRNNSYGCKKPHISVIGNITADELQGLLTTRDRANGFGNRFLWCFATRYQLKPLGGKPLDQAKLNALVGRITSALEAAQHTEQITFDATASETWEHEHYPQLTRSIPGLIGALTSRAETHVLRLATLYALLDSSKLIRPVHLDAALAVWRYCQDSVTFLFSDMIGDDAASSVLKRLRASQDGMTQTEINRTVFQSNKSAKDMERVLSMLLEARLIRSESVKTAGRPSTVWHAT
jgi:hypothetical protein